MADKQEAEEKTKEKAPEKQPMSVKKIVIIMSAAFSLLIIVIVVSLIFFLKDKPTSTSAKTESAAAQQQAKSDTQSGQATANSDITPVVEKQASTEKVDLKGPAIFYTIKPVFVVNLDSTRVKFLQISVDIMTRDKETITKITNNLPIIKNELLILFSNKSHDEVKTLEGREALRRQALKVVREVVEKEAGAVAIEDVLFTGFVMQ